MMHDSEGINTYIYKMCWLLVMMPSAVVMKYVMT